MRKSVISTSRGQRASSEPTSFASLTGASLAQHVRRIISRRKGIQLRRLPLSASFTDALAFDTVDLVDIILEVERQFHLTIPDEIPLHTVGDLVSYVGAHQSYLVYDTVA